RPARESKYSLMPVAQPVVFLRGEGCAVLARGSDAVMVKAPHLGIVVVRRWRKDRHARPFLNTYPTMPQRVLKARYLLPRRVEWRPRRCVASPVPRRSPQY